MAGATHLDVMRALVLVKIGQVKVALSGNVALLFRESVTATDTWLLWTGNWLLRNDAWVLVTGTEILAGTYMKPRWSCLGPVWSSCESVLASLRTVWRQGKPAPILS